jgi:hypothetical protein
MRDFLLDVGRRVRVPGGVLMTAASAVALLVEIPPLAGLPPDALAAGGVAIGTAALVWALRDQKAEIATKNALLDERARTDAALTEFRARLDEGNLVRQMVYRWRRINPEAASAAERKIQIKAETDRRLVAFRAAVKEWSDACVTTLETHYSHRTPAFQQRIELDAARDPIRHIPGLAAIRAEADQKWERLNSLQRELEAQSRRAAIS